MRALLAATASAPLAGCKPTSTGAPEDPTVTFEPGGPLPWINWAGNQACLPADRWAPGSEEELVGRIARSHARLRPVGAGHSFTPLVPTDGAIVSTDALSGIVPSDRPALTRDEAEAAVEVWAGTRLHQLGPLLWARGRALSNLPDIDYQTIAGATATSTHGTGVTFGSLSSLVEGLALVTPSGDLLECDRDRHPEIFDAARCSLGALGVITRLTLRTQPAYRLRERTRLEPLEPLLEEIETRAAAHRHFEFIAFPHTTVAAVTETDETTEGDGASRDLDPEGARRLRDAYRWVGGIPGMGDFIYDQLLRLSAQEFESARSGPAYAVLAHERQTRFREMEYTVPADAGPACLREIMAVARAGHPIVMPVEYRYVKGDDVWLSMFHGRDGCSISIHQFADEDHRAYFDAIEPIFWKYDGRPHWGKLHSLGAKELSTLYPRFGDFAALRAELDPTGKMSNDHLRRLFDLETARSA